jgi:RNA polymerase sigma factor (sigma-70 family)
MNEEEIANQAIELLRAGKVQAAAELLNKHLHTRMLRYLQRHRVPPDDAQELVTDVWMKFMNSRFDGQTRAVVWLWTVAGSVLLDWVRRQKTEKRGRALNGAVEVSGLDEVAWGMAMDQFDLETEQSQPWVKLCVDRAMLQFSKDDPRRAHVLWLWYQGWSAKELAVEYGAKPPPTQNQETAARNRVLEATRKAKDYLAHCKE